MISERAWHFCRKLGVERRTPRQLSCGIFFLLSFFFSVLEIEPRILKFGASILPRDIGIYHALLKLY